MKGYVYLDIDANLVFKTADYIETENPLFWADNHHMITKWWKFDTDQLSSMRTMLTQLRDLQLKMHIVNSFLATINFDITTLKLNASSIQSK